MTLLGATLYFDADHAIALTGADFSPMLDGAPFPMWVSRLVHSGQTLKLGGARLGARCYLAVRGGISVPQFLGSASTHLLSGLGGFEGRALRKGDVLEVGPAMPGYERLRAKAAALEHSQHLRFTPGPEWGWFSDRAHRVFQSAVYRVSDDSNRMGLRLNGIGLETPLRHMISQGVPLGAIQIPAGGQPIILFVEQQTTGGYPQIGNIISADLYRLGQLRPRDEIQFELVSFEQARTALELLEQTLRHIIEPDDEPVQSP
jgi:antagonist of KipI